MRARWKRHPLLGIFSGMVAVVFGIAMVWGQSLNSVGEIPVKQTVSWCALVVVSLECWYVLFLILCQIREGKIVLPAGSITEENAENGRRGLPVPVVWLLFLVCWLPSFLAVYPGFFLYDAYEEYRQVATGLFSAHHPLLHVLLLGKTICKVYDLTGAYNYGIALYTVLQMMVIAACFTYVLYWMKKSGIRKICRRIVFLFFAFFPNIVMFVLCSTKDMLFAAALLVSVLFYIEWFRRGEIGRREIKWFIPLILSQVLALMLRNNAVYAFVVFVLILMIAGKGKRTQIIAVSVITLCCYLAGSKGLVFALNARSGEKQEILTVPIQQISRGYRADRFLLTAEEKAVLFSYLPEDAIERYTPKLSDPVKIHFDNERYKQAKAPFWKLWMKLLVHNPIGYVNAWFMTSYGYWYPDADVDVYRGSSVFTHSYENSSYFGFETELPGERDSKLRRVEQFYRELSLEDIVQKTPGVSWMFSMGTLFWIYVFCACVLVAKKQYRRLIPFAFPAMVWLTLLLGPTYLPRYVAFMWFILPLIVIETMIGIGYE